MVETTSKPAALSKRKPLRSMLKRTRPQSKHRRRVRFDSIAQPSPREDGGGEGRVENRAGAYRISLRATPFRGRPVAAGRAGIGGGGAGGRRKGRRPACSAAVMVPSGVRRWCRGGGGGARGF